MALLANKPDNNLHFPGGLTVKIKYILLFYFLCDIIYQYTTTINDL